VHDEVLERLFQRYRRALALHRGPRVDLSVVDAVLEARVALYEHLVRTGWDAPHEVRRQLEIDALLLEQPPTALTG
jgi:phage portal protein BeeE